MTQRLAISLDTTRCRSYGICVNILPDVFDTPPGNPVAVQLVDSVDASERADVEEAVRNCPAQAISFELLAAP